jgi:hypothetical protein
MEKRPSKSDRRVIMERTAEATLQAIPFAGGPLATVFATAVGWSISKRTEMWLDELAEEVDRLGGVVENLVSDDRFVDATVRATRIAQGTHDRSKLAALRNAVLNSVAPDAPEVEEQARFMRLVDDFSSAHLRMLSLWHDPMAYFAERGLEPQQFMAAGRSAVLDQLSEWSGRRDWYDLIYGDLDAARLVNGALHATQTGASIYGPVTTELGERFLRYVSDPPDTE